MKDFLISQGLGVLFELLKKIPKTPADKRKWKNAMLKLRDGIDRAYADDSDFSK